MKLTELLIQVTVVNNDVEVRGMTLDSRKVQAGDVFFALQGAEHHGLEYARQAVADGLCSRVLLGQAGGTQYQNQGQGENPFHKQLCSVKHNKPHFI